MRSATTEWGDELVTLPQVRILRGGFCLEIPAADLPAGSVLGVFGHSGSGKTTYARALFNERPAGEVVYLPQADSLLDDITVEQNVLLTGSPFLSHIDLSRQICAYADTLDMSDRLSSYGRRLSGGERRRTLLMRSFAAPGSILILDEPFVGLGWRDEVRAREFFRTNRSQFKLVVLISHSTELVWSLCDRIWVMSEGRRVGEIFPQQPEHYESLTLQLADSLGMTNIIRVSALAELCDDLEILGFKESPGAYLGAWLADSRLGDRPEDGSWQVMGRLKSQLVHARRYALRSQRIVELYDPRRSGRTMFLRDETSDPAAPCWISFRSVFWIAS